MKFDIKEFINGNSVIKCNNTEEKEIWLDILSHEYKLRISNTALNYKAEEEYFLCYYVGRVLIRVYDSKITKNINTLDDLDDMLVKLVRLNKLSKTLIDEYNLKNIKNDKNKIKVEIIGCKTIVTLANGERGEAICSDKDVFSASTGIVLAFNRAVNSKKSNKMNKLIIDDMFGRIKHGLKDYSDAELLLELQKRMDRRKQQ